MKSKVLALLLALILMAAATPADLAQTNNSGQQTTSPSAQDWQGLRDLKPGEKILVEFKSSIGDPVEGKFISASGSKLTLSDDGYQLSLEQRDIQSVYQLKGRWSRSKTAKIGAGIGMVIGTIIGVGRELRLEEEVGHVPSQADTTPTFAGLFIGTFVGAGLGALVGGKRKGKLLYEAK
jgi:hypothetical protein